MILAHKLPPAYQYNVGEVIETHDDNFGIITDRTDAYNFMAIEKNVTEALIRSYSNIAIYKVLINGKITYVNESNIRGAISWSESRKKKL